MAALSQDTPSSQSQFYFTWHGKIVTTEAELEAARLSGVPLRVWPRLLGGKGGFGSLLRSIGSQIDKTTNREMCRDLSGRRMRDVNNQKRLAEWAAGAGSRAAERQKRREEKRRRRREILESADGPAGHVMQDGRYLVEKERIVDSVFTAVQDTFKSRKRSAEDQPSTSAASSAAASTSAGAAGPSRPPKAVRKWLEADLEDLEGSSSSSSSSSTSGDSGDEAALTNQKSSNRGSIPDQAAREEDIASSYESEEGGEPRSHVDDAKGGEPKSHVDDAKGGEPRSHVDDAKGGEPRSHVDDAKGSQRTAMESRTVEASNSSTSECSEDQLCDLASIESLEAAERLGLDALKTQLRLRGLKCGGSLRDRAQRLLGVRGLSPDQYPKSLLAARPPAK